MDGMRQGLLIFSGLTIACISACSSNADDGSKQTQAGTGGTSYVVSGGSGGVTASEGIRAAGGLQVVGAGGKTIAVRNGGSGAVGGKKGETGGKGGGAGGRAGGGKGTCCPDGNCLCHGEPLDGLGFENGPYATETYTVAAGCVYYPTDAEPPFAAVAISDGFMGAGGCLMAQTGGWGPFLSSWGIVTMIVNTTAADMPQIRGGKLLGGIEAFKAENETSGSPLFGKLSGRYGTSGFSMGGGGTTMAATEDPSLKVSVGIMAWTPVGQGVTVPTLFICGTADTLAFCSGHGGPAYAAMPETTPKMMITVNSAHIGQPSTGGGMSGAWGLAFHKVFLEGDERWRPLLIAGGATQTNIQ